MSELTLAGGSREGGSARARAEGAPPLAKLARHAEPRPPPQPPLQFQTPAQLTPAPRQSRAERRPSQLSVSLGAPHGELARHARAASFLRERGVDPDGPALGRARLGALLGQFAALYGDLHPTHVAHSYEHIAHQYAAASGEGGATAAASAAPAAAAASAPAAADVGSAVDAFALCYEHILEWATQASVLHAPVARAADERATPPSTAHETAALPPATIAASIAYATAAGAAAPPLPPPSSARAAALAAAQAFALQSAGGEHDDAPAEPHAGGRFGPPVCAHEKSAAQVAMLHGFLVANAFTRSLSRRERAEAVLRLQPREHAAGALLMREGEMACSDSHFHLIEHGTVAITIHGVLVNRAIRGMSVGELALLYDGMPRCATVVAEEAVRTWVLTRAEFQRLLRASSEQYELEVSRWLHNVPLLVALSPYDKLVVTRTLAQTECAPSEVVVRAAEPARAFYIVLEGELTSERLEPATGARSVQTLTAGDFWGEASLEASLEPSLEPDDDAPEDADKDKDKAEAPAADGARAPARPPPAGAGASVAAYGVTVTAVRECRLLRMDAVVFRRLLGKYSDRMHALHAQRDKAHRGDGGGAEQRGLHLPVGDGELPPTMVAADARAPRARASAGARSRPRAGPL
jgi:CRP-like cAMP-binding protein